MVGFFSSLRFMLNLLSTAKPQYSVINLAMGIFHPSAPAPGVSVSSMLVICKSFVYVSTNADIKVVVRAVLDYILTHREY